MGKIRIFSKASLILWAGVASLALGEGPSTTPVQQPGTAERHIEKVAAVKKEKFDLLLIGDSITHNFEAPPFQPVWKQFYEPRHALNLGYSGGRTENILWNLQNGELEGQSPKVVTLMIGTNNADGEHFPTAHNGQQIGEGITAIVKILREKLPDTKIILLRCFPFGESPKSNPRRDALNEASEIAQKLADNQHVFFCDINHVFLNPDGTTKKEMMPDFLHPSPEGARLWAQAMEPLLCKLMGDTSRDTNKPVNTAVVPTPKLEDDSYDWWTRHADVLKVKQNANPEIVLIGDSITHFWGGEPKAHISNGPKAWDSVFGKHKVLNLGFGWDRTQNVLWRLDHGEFDGLHPRAVVLHIGTNNTAGTPNARENTPDEIAEGVRAICTRIHSKSPDTTILLMAVMPREEKADNPRRATIKEINQRLAELGKVEGIRFLDIGPKMLQADGTLSKEIAPDFCHPSEKGYQIWADSLKPEIEKILGTSK
ncbi:MAG TPA: GDSL-type esterase/lipase family protein [Candidatus Sumerlaeota bacterium]|nr:GDSL-type esterase/lipase family protein [Candidatus Sumerlaeota bacterium]